MSDQFDTSKYGQIQKQQGAAEQIAARDTRELLADMASELKFSYAILCNVQAQLDRIERVVTGNPSLMQGEAHIGLQQEQTPLGQQTGTFVRADQNS
jgi:hypothetical protein